MSTADPAPQDPGTPAGPPAPSTSAGTTPGQTPGSAAGSTAGPGAFSSTHGPSGASTAPQPPSSEHFASRPGPETETFNATSDSGSNSASSSSSSSTDHIASFFASVRRTGLVRASDRWFGGVASGLALRLGIDALLVRAAFGVLALISGAGFVLYALAWALLPEQSDGRIHLEETIRGRFDAAIAGAGVMLVVGLNWHPGRFGWWGSWGFGWFDDLFSIALFVFVVSVFVTARRRRRDRANAGAGSTSNGNRQWVRQPGAPGGWAQQGAPGGWAQQTSPGGSVPETTPGVWAQHGTPNGWTQQGAPGGSAPQSAPGGWAQSTAGTTSPSSYPTSGTPGPDRVSAPVPTPTPAEPGSAAGAAAPTAPLRTSASAVPRAASGGVTATVPAGVNLEKQPLPHEPRTAPYPGTPQGPYPSPQVFPSATDPLGWTAPSTPPTPPTPPAPPTVIGWTSESAPSRGPGRVAIGLVASIALLGFAALLVADRTGSFDGDVAITALGGLAVLAGLGVVVSGLRGRKSGTLGFFAIVAIVLAGPLVSFQGVGTGLSAGSTTFFGDSTYRPDSSTVATDGFAVGMGSTTLDLTAMDLPRGETVEVPVHVGAGDLTVIVPEGVPVSATVDLGTGTIEWRVDGDTRSESAFGRSTTFESSAVQDGDDARIHVSIAAGAGTITIEDAS